MIAVDNVSKSFGPKLALDRVSLKPAPGSTTVLLGPSGCGKSTLLRVMTGLVVPDAGRVTFDGAPLTATNLQPVRHRIGYVIQDGGLFPHLTGYDNVALLARHLRWEKRRIDDRVTELRAVVRLSADVLERYPAQLSGGERHRVALMRALMLDPAALLFDEPLAALDATTRREVQTELKSIFISVKRTAILVTHDLQEAAWLGDDIALMRAGRIVQQGSLQNLLDHPAETFVRDFIHAQRADPRLVER